MKLACVAPAYPYRGGIAHFGARLARHLALRHSILYINFSRLYPGILFPGKTQFDNSASPLDFSTERIVDSIWPPTWKRAGARIRAWGADAVIFHWWHPFFAPAYRSIARRVGSGTAILAICHNVAPHEYSRLQEYLAAAALGRMNGVVLHARSEEERFRELVPHKPYITLFHPVYDIFPGERLPMSVARSLLGFEPQDRIVLYFGLIRPYKGVDILLAAAKLLGDIPNLKIVIVGEIYSQRELIHAMALSAPNRMVTMVDHYIPNEEVATWFRVADLVVLPYRSSTQSGVVPIAYRCQRPVIVTRVGGLPDMVEDGVSGYLVEPENPQKLAAAIRRHFIELGNPDLSEGIEQMNHRLSWDNYSSRLETFIDQLIAARYQVG